MERDTKERKATTGETVQGVETTFDIIEFLEEADGAEVATVAEELGLAVSTVHRHLTTLYRRGFVTKEDGAYTPSLRFLEVGEKTRAGRRENEVAKTKVDDLAVRTDERAQFIAEEHDRAVYVYKSIGARAVETDTRVGKRVPLNASAGGLAILAHLPENRVEEIVESRGLPSRTPKTISDPELLFEECERIRDRGYSVNDQGFIEGLRAIGVPVMGPNDDVLGALSVSGPTNRMRGEWFEDRLPALLLGAANELELKIAFP